MGLTGDMARFRRYVQETATAAARARVEMVAAVGAEVREVLREEFASSTDPAGGSWERTARGKPALVSKKLPQSTRFYPVPSGVLFTSRIPWLEAHQEGHTFAARKAGGQVLTFDKRGRLISERRAARSRFVFDVKAKEHDIKARTLPAREIYPEGGAMPPRWAGAVGRGVTQAVARTVGGKADR